MAAARGIAKLTVTVATILFVCIGIVGLVLTEQVFWQEWRWTGLIVGNLLFPFAAFVAAMYDGFANGDWTLALVDASGFLFFGAAALLSRQSS